MDVYYKKDNNNIITEVSYIEQQGFIKTNTNEQVIPGMIVNADGTFSMPPKSLSLLQADIREKRDRLLRPAIGALEIYSHEKALVADGISTTPTYTKAQAQELSTYWRALRDVPQQSIFTTEPEKVVWPVKPSFL